jgi:glycosyltransferase involved in cell wall biosynthesis
VRITAHDFGGYSFTAQLARALAAQGHDVEYLFAAGIKAPRARVVPREGDAETIEYRGVVLDEAYRVGAGVRRLRQERRYGAVLAREVTRSRPDVVISANTPLIAQRAAQVAAAEVGAAFVHWLQDVYSDAVARLLRRKLPVVGRLIGAPLARLERTIVLGADAVVLIADDFRATMDRWGVAAERTSVIENWAPLDEIEPRERVNRWSEQRGLSSETVLLYAGTLGRKHDPDLLLHLAAAIPDAQVVVVAEGTGMDRLRSTSRVPGNLRLLPLEPSDVVPDMLATADVLIALLSEDAGAFSVPSKVLTYLAAGRPTVAVVPRANLAARMVTDSGGGLVVAPGGAEGLTTAVRRYVSDPELRIAAGRSARAYAERTFDVRVKAAQFESVLLQALQRAHTRRERETDTSLVMKQPRRESDR